MATEEMITSLPTVASATMSDIIYAVQGYTSPTSLGLSVQETLGQVFTLFQSNVILVNSGNPNGVLAGTTYQFAWDQVNSILYICTLSGTATTAVWTRANINSGYTTTPTAAATTTLTVQSTYWQFFTGTTTQTVVMPVASTCAAGMTWSIVNNSTGVITVESSGLNTIVTLSAGEVAMVTCILNSGTSAASWNAIVSAVGGGVTSITGTANQVIASASSGAVTLSTPQDIAPASSPTFNALTLTGTPLAKTSGGTGSSTVITNPNATSWAGWDANKNMSANNFIEGYTTTATAAGTTVITVASTYWQYFTGSTTQTVTMPVTSTLVLGQAWEFVNNSTGVVTVQSSGGNTITAMAAGTSAVFTCILTSGTTAASWNSDYSLNTVGVASITGTANQVIASASTGAVTLSLPQNIATTSAPTFAGLTLTNPYILSAGGLHSFQVFTSGTAATYTRPANVSSILVELVGGGGAGGGSVGNVSGTAFGAGGGAGGYVVSYIPSAASTYTYTVGAAGAGSSGNNGGAGGNTTFSTFTASAGAGGNAMVSISTAASSSSAGGAGGAASGGGIANVPGQGGGAGYTSQGNGFTGFGGSNIYGSGAPSKNSAGTGTAGTGFGAGGGGGLSTTVTAAGGAGTSGIIIVWEFA